MNLHRILKRLFCVVTVPIQAGPLRGKKWIISSGIRFIRGTYVERDARILTEHIKKGETVYDVGAHVGYFTVLSSILVGNDGKVFAFEPVPLNLLFLNKHIRINHCGNVKVIETCLSDTIGEASFDDSHGSATGHLSQNGRCKVPVTTLNAMVAGGVLPPPDFIKINAEGAEQTILQGGLAVIEKYKPRLLITFHSEELKANCIKMLEENGYIVQLTSRDALYAEKAAAEKA